MAPTEPVPPDPVPTNPVPTDRGPAWEFFADPRPFLAAAGDLLTAEPLLGSVIATFTARIAAETEAGEDSWAGLGAPFERWWAVLRGVDGDVVSAAMRTAPFAPWPTYSLPLAPAAARLLARTLHERGERLAAVNGSLPGVDLLAQESARLRAGRAVQHAGLRLWEASEVAVPPPPPGRLRRATEADLRVVQEYYVAFRREADLQAGRDPATGEGEVLPPAQVLDRVRAGTEWLWEGEDGAVAHLTSRSLPAYGVCRLGPVYSPPDRRGAGIASYVVAELTRQGLAEGSRMCLFTDLENPVSNRIYTRLGYRPVADTAEWLVLD